MHKALESIWLPYLVVLVIGFALYANTIPHDYALDDKVVIAENPFTQKGLKGIGDILSHDTFSGFYGGQVALVRGGRYRPLSLVTFAVERQLFGQNPHISHLINVLLYALTGIVLYGLLSTLLAPGRSKRGWYFSLPFVATLLYVAHPLHTEVVANIKGRDDIMALLGALLALRYTIRYLATNKAIYLVTSFVVFLLALMSKENAIAFVAVIPLTVFFFTDHKARRNLVSAAPLLVAAVAYMALRHAALGGPRVETVPDLMNNPFLDASKGEELATVVYTWLIYAKLLIFPHPLTFDYYPKQIAIIGLANPRAIASVLLCSALVAIAVAGFRKKGRTSYGIWFYALTFLPVSNLVFNVGAFMNERFMYIPSLGFCLVVAYLLVGCAPRLFKSEEIGRCVLAGVVIAILCLYGAIVTGRNRVWANDYTLCTHDVRVSSKSAKSAWSAGQLLVEEAVKLRDIRTRGNSAGEMIARIGKETLLPKEERAEFLASDSPDTLRSKIERRESEMHALASKYLNRALEIHPTYIGALLALANAHCQYDGDYEKAAEICVRVLWIDPNSDIAYLDLESCLEQCDVDLQIRMWEEALRVNPSRFEPNFHLGILYGHYKNDLGKAVAFLERSVQLNPMNSEAYNNLGVAYGLAGRSEDAIRTLERAAQLNPTDAQVYVNLGVAYSSLGNEEQALRCSRKAEELQSNPQHGGNGN
ncbi:MAG: tetratricopeptide repeat protein [Candidatus Eisenbacteria bacterium]